jgi:hypothetical protein
MSMITPDRLFPLSYRRQIKLHWRSLPEVIYVSKIHYAIADALLLLELTTETLISLEFQD